MNAPVLRLVSVTDRPEREQLLLRPFYAMTEALTQVPMVVRYGCRRRGVRRATPRTNAAAPAPADLLAYRPKRRARSLVAYVPPPPAQPDVPREPLPNTGSRVIRRLRLNRLEREQLRADEAWIRDAGIERPAPHADCDEVDGPCPWVSCRQHLYLDVNPRNGSVKLNFPHLEVWEMAETCAIRAAKAGESSLSKIGKLLNVSMERARQVLNPLVAKLKLIAPREDEET